MKKFLYIVFVLCCMSGQAYALTHHIDPAAHHHRQDTEHRRHSEKGCCGQCGACSFENIYHEKEKDLQLHQGKKLAFAGQSSHHSIDVVTRVFKPPR